jgi:hypothetical protein
MALNDGANDPKALTDTSRAKTSDPRVQNQDFFPTEAFEFDDPNDLKGTDVELKMKEGWKFYVDQITLEQLNLTDRELVEGAIIRSKNNELDIINMGGAVNINADEIELRVKAVGPDGEAARDAVIRLAKDAEGESYVYVDASSIYLGDVDDNPETLDGVLIIENDEVVFNGTARSGNYVEGSSGWKISHDGNAEFNDGTFRGDLDAATGTFEGLAGKKYTAIGTSVGIPRGSGFIQCRGFAGASGPQPFALYYYDAQQYFQAGQPKYTLATSILAGTTAFSLSLNNTNGTITLSYGGSLQNITATVLRIL